MSNYQFKYFGMRGKAGFTDYISAFADTLIEAERECIHHLKSLGYTEIVINHWPVA